MNHLSSKTIKPFAKIFTWSILTYGCELWSLEKVEQGNFQTMELWILR